MSEMKQLVELEVDGAVARLRLNHPPLNILTVELRRQFVDRIGQIEKNPAVRLVVIEAAGDKAFSVGSDLKEFPQDEAGGRRKIEFEQSMLDQVERLNAVTISVLRGYVLGGGAELMLATDLRIAAEDAEFGFPEVKVGGFPAAGGVWRLARDIGPMRARELLLFGKVIHAPEAKALNLIHECVARERVIDRVGQLVEELLALPQTSLLAIKRTVALSSEFHLAARVTDEYGRLFRGEDMFEGIRAFLEKRAPRFNRTAGQSEPKREEAGKR